MVDLCVAREFSNHDVSKIKTKMTNTEAKEVVMKKITYTKKKQGCSSRYIWYSEIVNLFRQ